MGLEYTFSQNNATQNAPEGELRVLPSCRDPLRAWLRRTLGIALCYVQTGSQRLATCECRVNLIFPTHPASSPAHPHPGIFSPAWHQRVLLNRNGKTPCPPGRSSLVSQAGLPLLAGSSPSCSLTALLR